MTQIIRRLEKEGYEIYWFYVWEHQKRGALHQHWCIASPEGHEFCKNLGRLLVVKWYQLLQELSDKECVDLFKKRGAIGTWRNTPKIWQHHVKQVRKSVAAYFSKYCSKNANTSQYNSIRRESYKRIKRANATNGGTRRVYSLCPSRYWGSGSRVKRICAEYRVTISFDVASSREGTFIADTIYNWCLEISNIIKKVSRSFKALSADTGYVYAQGWEFRAWVEASTHDQITALFKRIHLCDRRKLDAIGAICDLDDF